MTPDGARRIRLTAILVALGFAWGLTQPLAKIAVSGSYRGFGIIFWESAIAALALGAWTLCRGGRLPLGAVQLRLYGVIALCGNLIPGAAGYGAAVHLPAGVLAIVMSLIPMMAFPIALGLGIDRFDWKKLAGLALGLLGIVFLVVPKQSLPDPGLARFLPLALIAPLFYALESNIVSKWGLVGLDAGQLLLGASLVSMAISLPVALGAGLWINPVHVWGLPDLALVTVGMIHVIAYTTYIWLVGQAGAVFAAQVSYLVTGFGIVGSMLVLDETYSSWVWLALAVMLTGLSLVQPRPKHTLVDPAALREDRPAIE